MAGLMCCLKYEHPFYTEFARTAPAVAKLVTMEDGDGVFVGHQAPADSVVIRMHANGATRCCSLCRPPVVLASCMPLAPLRRRSRGCHARPDSAAPV